MTEISCDAHEGWVQSERKRCIGGRTNQQLPSRVVRLIVLSEHKDLGVFYFHHPDSETKTRIGLCPSPLDAAVSHFTLPISL